ncbi:MAG TPA: DUF2892 domain-containing protein [Cyanobacteria bacterium UBA9971]|nr:DUF2892 domain-containing protein [Cyanobacteria bacterium UBA9971]
MYLAKTDNWYLERVVWLIAGIFTILSAALAYFVSPYWLILTAFVGINLIIFAFTGFCIMANLLVKLGFKSRIKD